MSQSPRAALLQKAIDFFIQHGVGDTSLRALATGIGSSHRMLIYHFGSREGLLTAAVSQIWASQEATMHQLADATPDDPTEGAWLYWTMLADRSAVTPLVFEMSAQAMHGAPWKDAFADGGQMMVEHVADRLVEFGETRGHATVLSRMCVSVMLGALWEMCLTGNREAADQTVRAFLDAAWPAGRAG